jgi:hypothetical protein
VRVSTAFKRLLRLPGASVADVWFGAEGVIVTVRLRRRRRVCAQCGQTGRLEIHDRRVKRWRHLDVGASRCWIECELRLLRCSDCGVRLEPVPWARPGDRERLRARPCAARRRGSVRRAWRSLRGEPLRRRVSGSSTPSLTRCRGRAGCPDVEHYERTATGPRRARLDWAGGGSRVHVRVAAKRDAGSPGGRRTRSASPLPVKPSG